MNQNIKSGELFTPFSDLTELLINLVKKLPNKPSIKVAFLGYQDLLLPNERWIQLMSIEKFKELRIRPNSEKILKIHKKVSVEIVPEIDSVIAAIFGNKVKVDTFDFTKYHGTEIIHDFNYPIPKKFNQKYDIVMDYGTTEHIFDYAQALKNMYSMTNLDGLICHVGPFDMFNHGFYGLNPTLFHDFYEDNGCSTENAMLFNFVPDQSSPTKYRQVQFKIPNYHRVRIREHPEIQKLLEISIAYLVRKNSHFPVPNIPIQQKYRNKELWM
tara:strand:- start:2 stop:811 length:810 start_codon:yes stop_codon:yes gene_type:complete